MANYHFKYINRPSKAFRSWTNNNRDFDKYGEMEYFFGILCPVSTANVDCSERIRAEYDTIEKLVLKLYSLGIHDKAAIAGYTGLKEDMVKNILEILENGYMHIKDGHLTEEGQKSLEQDLNISVFRTTKQIQYEAITGSLLHPMLFHINNDENSYFFARDKSWIYKYDPNEYVIGHIRRDIIENFGTEKNYDSERNVEQVYDVKVESCTYVEAFVIKYTFMPHPFIIFPYEESLKPRFYPVSLSNSNAEILNANKISFYNYTPPIRPDKDFERLIAITNGMNFASMRQELSEEFEIGKGTYRMAKKGTEGVERMLHPDCHQFLPCYCVRTNKNAGDEGGGE